MGHHLVKGTLAICADVIKGINVAVVHIKICVGGKLEWLMNTSSPLLNGGVEL